MNLEKELYTYFRYNSFRSLQKDIVKSILEGNNTLALLPTGAGKSVCFQLPAVLLPGITIVVSPLIALMKDQVDNLLKKNISATYLSSTLSETEKSERLKSITQQKFKIIYVSPERLGNKNFISICQKLSISLIVVDEAHCISEWGHDFRPSYLKIHSFVSLLTEKPKICAFTATATEKTVKDINTQLQLKDVKIFRQSFLRKNLHIRILHCPTTLIQESFLFLLLQRYSNKSGIIYTSTRQGAADLSNLINSIFPSKNKLSAFYHANMQAEERQNTQQLFISNTIPIIVATSAFGMGIDKPDIAFVIHFHIPASIEQYYQEIGRAGRDGEVAECYMLYNKNNLEIQETLLQNIENEDFFQLKKEKLLALTTYCDIPTCRQSYLVQYFNEKMVFGCEACDNCLQIKDGALGLLDFLLSAEQKENIKILKQRRDFLKNKFSLEHSAEILTNTQLLLVTAVKPKNGTEFRNLPSFGDGWCKKWLKYFLPPDVTIQLQ